MKRVDLVRHLEKSGCRLLRDKGKHSVYENPSNSQVTAVPRHREINDFLAQEDLPRLGYIPTVVFAVETPIGITLSTR